MGNGTYRIQQIRIKQRNHSFRKWQVTLPFHEGVVSFFGDFFLCHEPNKKGLPFSQLRLWTVPIY